MISQQQLHYCVVAYYFTLPPEHFAALSVTHQQGAGRQDQYSPPQHQSCRRSETQHCTLM